LDWNIQKIRPQRPRTEPKTRAMGLVGSPPHYPSLIYAFKWFSKKYMLLNYPPIGYQNFVRFFI
jgi:hypothetical protein